MSSYYLAVYVLQVFQNKDKSHYFLDETELYGDKKKLPVEDWVYGV